MLNRYFVAVGLRTHFSVPKLRSNSSFFFFFFSRRHFYSFSTGSPSESSSNIESLSSAWAFATFHNFTFLFKTSSKLESLLFNSESLHHMGTWADCERCFDNGDENTGTADDMLSLRSVNDVTLPYDSSKELSETKFQHRRYRICEHLKIMHAQVSEVTKTFTVSKNWTNFKSKFDNSYSIPSRHPKTLCTARLCIPLKPIICLVSL